MSHLPNLNIAIINNPELYELYKNKVEAHNTMVKVSSTPDSGFDLFIPNEQNLIIIITLILFGNHYLLI